MEVKLRELIKKEMLAKKATGITYRYQTYKNILEKAQKEAKDKKIEHLSDELILNAAKRELKQLEETLSFYKKEDARFKETEECIVLVKELLPKMVTSEEILMFLKENEIEKNMGLCMKALKNQFGSSLDGKMASGVVKEYISE